MLASLFISVGLISVHVYRHPLGAWWEAQTSAWHSRTSGHATMIDDWNQGLRQAQQAAIGAQTAQFSEEWQIVADHWQGAIASLERVPRNNPNYEAAQAKLEQYRTNLSYAQANADNPPLWINAINHANRANQLLPQTHTVEDWKKVAYQWKQSLDLLAVIAENDPNYAQAQQKIPEYERNFAYALSQIPGGDAQSIIPEDQFRLAVNDAMTAATNVQTANSAQDWRQVIDQWKQAIAHLKSITSEEDRYIEAQTKIEEYTTYLAYAEANLRQTGEGVSLKKTITGGLSPKSVVYSGNGLFFAQNMMYSHTIGIYNTEYQLIRTLEDQVNLADYGYSKYQGSYRGAPVEATFSHNGQWAWVSNYQMYGAGFNRPGDDVCSPSNNYDHSYVYRINTDTFTIEKVIQVGAVPKFLAASPDDRYVLVSNWCSYDLSVIETASNREIQRIPLGAYPRGIAVEPSSQVAYVAIMGSQDLARVSLKDFSVEYIQGVGNAPRHVVIDPVEGRYLYVTLNGDSQVAKIDLQIDRVIAKTRTGAAPRSMTISDDGAFLYVVNYDDNTMSKVRTADMQVLQTVSTNSAPIGITYNPLSREIWVACYSGSLMVFQD